MPIYEYRCQSCGAEVEELVRMSTKDDEVQCPECGKYQLTRKLSVFSGRVSGGSSGSFSSSGSGGCGPSGFS